MVITGSANLQFQKRIFNYGCKEFRAVFIYVDQLRWSSSIKAGNPNSSTQHTILAKNQPWIEQSCATFGNRTLRCGEHHTLIQPNSLGAQLTTIKTDV